MYRFPFPKPGSGLWDVHGRYETRMAYDNGVIVTGGRDSSEKPNGVLFTGSEGWLFVSRGAYAASPNEPVSTKSKALQASDLKILSPLTENDPVRLYQSSDHHGNWLECIRNYAFFVVICDFSNNNTQSFCFTLQT